MPNFEYKTIKLAAKGWFLGGNVDTDDIDAELNRLGKQGWELVSAVDSNQFGGETKYVVFIFKRVV